MGRILQLERQLESDKLDNEVCSDTFGADCWLCDAAGEHVDHQEAEWVTFG